MLHCFFMYISATLTRGWAVYILFTAYSYQYKYCINDKIYFYIVLKLFICIHHSCNHLLWWTSCKNPWSIVEAGTSMTAAARVATATNDQENCHNNNINSEAQQKHQQHNSRSSNIDSSSNLPLPTLSLSFFHCCHHLHHFTAAIIISIVLPLLSLSS